MALNYYNNICRENKLLLVTEDEYLSCEGFLIHHVDYFTTLEFSPVPVVTKKHEPIMNYYDRFQEIIDNMKDSDMPSEKVLHITQMFETIEYMIKEKLDIE